MRVILFPAASEDAHLAQLLKDLRVARSATSVPPKFYCSALEENQSCAAAAESKTHLARAKHIAAKYDSFRNLVDKKVFRIKHPSTTKVAGVLAKPIDNNQFFKLRHMLEGW